MNAEFVRALLKLKKEIAPIVKSQTGYGYKYADLAEVHKSIDEPLLKNGFFLYHEFSTADGQTYMDTHLIHEHGELSSTLPLDVRELAKMNFYQAMGSAITYLRRYAVMALLSLPAEDDDGNSAAQPKQRPPANGNGQKVKPQNTDDMKRAFLQRDSYHVPMPSADGKPNVTLWADKFCELLPFTGSGTQIDKLATDNGTTLDWLRSEHPDVSARIMKALQDAHSAVSQARTLAAE